MDKKTESLAREKFEERVRFHYQYPELAIEPEGSPCAGEYVCTVRQDEWVQWKSAWTASRESLVVELPEPACAGTPYSTGWNESLHRSEAAIRAIGIRIKGEGDGEKA
ncbi:hypothetical protein [Serratia fonticola]|uniref:hypothetical protein n=1 Tax=Serratia fonticola TaxID=47917 RepID=UPI003AAB89EC